MNTTPKRMRNMQGLIDKKVCILNLFKHNPNSWIYLTGFEKYQVEGFRAGLLINNTSTIKENMKNDIRERLCRKDSS